MEKFEVLMDRYPHLIPKDPVPLSEVIQEITQEFGAHEIDTENIPNLWMHRYNAVHSEKNEEKS